MVLVCLLSDALLQHLPSYLGFSYLGRGVSSQATPPDLECGVAPSGPYSKASLLAQMVKHLPAMWETWVRSLGWEDPLEKEMATHSSTLAWKIPWAEEPGGL